MIYSNAIHAIVSRTKFNLVRNCVCENRLSDSFYRAWREYEETIILLLYSCCVTNHRNLITCEYKSRVWEIVVWQTLDTPLYLYIYL